MNYAHHLIKITLVFHAPYLSNEDGDYQYFYFNFYTSKSLSVRSRSLKKIYQVENFCANVLNPALDNDAENLVEQWLPFLAVSNLLANC